ncbi:hypothetical protein [Pelotomaculum terephthalicicum]|nr:hypothetical protein [Pelotomaculum terephthalicicum]
MAKGDRADFAKIYLPEIRVSKVRVRVWRSRCAMTRLRTAL